MRPKKDIEMYLRISIQHRKLILGRGLHNVVRIDLLTSSLTVLDSHCGGLLYNVRQFLFLLEGLCRLFLRPM